MTVRPSVLAPYVPTPPEVVECMVRIAGTTASDLVYDLGCGDGRLAIAAAATRGARSLGVDIEPYWVEQSRLNASLAGVSGLAHFEEGDATYLDLRPATVVFLYLVHWSTQRLADAVLRQCSSGTRVVSHTFPFDAFPSARTEWLVDGSGQRRAVHLWVTPGAPLA